MGIRSDLKLIERSIRQRWPIPDSSREDIVLEMLRIVGNDAAGERAKIMAAKTLVAMDTLNQKDEHVSQLQSDRNRFLEIAERLGIRENPAGILTDGTDDNSAVVIDSTAHRAG